MNIVAISGNLTADPTVNYASEGTAYCYFTIAAKRPHTKDKVDFIRCVAWRKTAEFIGKWFKKGQRIEVHGYIATGQYTDKNSGEIRYTTDVNVNEVGFGDSKKSDGQEKPKENKQARSPQRAKLQSFDDFDDENPF